MGNLMAKVYFMRLNLIKLCTMREKLMELQAGLAKLILIEVSGFMREELMKGRRMEMAR